MKGITLLIGFTIAFALALTGLLSILNAVFGLRLAIEGTVAPANAHGGSFLLLLGASLALALLPLQNEKLAGLLRGKPVAIAAYAVLLLALPAIPVMLLWRIDQPYNKALNALFARDPDAFNDALLSALTEEQKQQLFAESIRHKNTEIARRILPRLAQANGEREFSNAALALYTGNKEILRLLIEKNADFSYRQPTGGGLLHVLISGDADEESQLGCLQVLHAARLAGVNDRDEFGRTPLILAAERARPRLVKTLLRYGADLQAKDEFGNTVLHFVCSKSHIFTDVAENNRIQTAKVLLAKGASAKAKNQLGEDCLARATRDGLTELVAYLKKK